MKVKEEVRDKTVSVPAGSGVRGSLSEGGAVFLWGKSEHGGKISGIESPP